MRCAIDDMGMGIAANPLQGGTAEVLAEEPDLETAEGIAARYVGGSDFPADDADRKRRNEDWFPDSIDDLEDERK